MKKYQPTKRLVALGKVLQYDNKVFKCELKEERFFKWIERLLINRERARIMAKDNSYRQTEVLEEKIEAVLKAIDESGWKPENEIEYD